MASEAVGPGSIPGGTSSAKPSPPVGSSADFEPDNAVRTLTICIHHMTAPAHDRAIALLLADLTQAELRHPETGQRFVYQLV